MLYEIKLWREVWWNFCETKFKVRMQAWTGLPGHFWGGPAQKRKLSLKAYDYYTSSNF